MIASRFGLFGLWVCSSYAYEELAMLTLSRPVVIAENMIGVAMYELVRD